MEQLIEEINTEWEVNLKSSNSLQKLLLDTAHPSWIPVLKNSNLIEKLTPIDEFLKSELDTYGTAMAILPRCNNVFKALEIPVDELKVVIIGQDVYPNIRKLKKQNNIFKEEAMGLCFSVPSEINIPPSLKNIYKEILRTEHTSRVDGNLLNWSKQGVLMLNSALTVRQYAAGSHLKVWNDWTDELITSLSITRPDLIYMLWGNFAKEKEQYIKKASKILKAGHPSPLNRSKSFIGCGHFSEVTEISW